MRHILLMLALAVSASGQQLLTYQVCDPTQHCGLWLQEKDDASLLAAWIEQQHQEWLIDRASSERGWMNQEKPHPDFKEGCNTCHWQENGGYSCTVLACYSGGTVIYSGDNQPVTVGDHIEAPTPKTHTKRPKPTNQPVWLIDGRRAYLTCPDDKRQDCTLSVSRPSGHAVSTHTKAGK